MTNAEYQTKVFSFLDSFQGEATPGKDLIPNEKAKPFFRQLVMDYMDKNRKPFLIEIKAVRNGKEFEYVLKKVI